MIANTTIIRLDARLPRRKQYRPYAWQRDGRGQLLIPLSPAQVEPGIRRMHAKILFAKCYSCRSHPLECAFHLLHDITRVFPFFLRRLASLAVWDHRWEEHPDRETRLSMCSSPHEQSR